MGRRSLGSILVIALAGLLLAGAVASGAEEQQAPPTKKKPALKPTTPPAQPQPAPQGSSPAAQKDKAPKDPRDAGLMNIVGRITSVHANQRQLIIRTNSNEFKVYITPVTQLTRDGQPVDLKALNVNDKVETCRFNAKHVVQILKVTSAEKNLVTLPNPAKQ
jgi:hypothetical protein